MVVGSRGEGSQSGGGKGQQFGGVCGTGDGASHPVTSTSAVVAGETRGGGAGGRELSRETACE